MKYSKVVLGGLLSIASFGAACDKYKSVPTVVGTGESPSVAVSNLPGVRTSSTPTTNESGFSIIQTPRPASNLEDKSPVEPSPFKTSAPFIVGRSPVPFGDPNVAPSTIPQLPIIPGKVNGRVYGYDVATKTYRTLSNATVSVGGTVLTADASGRYTTTEDVTDKFDLSADADNFIASTVTGIFPGENRDIHLQPLDDRERFNTNTITNEILTLAAAEPTTPDLVTSSSAAPAAAAGGSATPIPAPSYPSVLSFGDNDGSRFVTTLLDSVTGRIRVEINPLANKSTASGKLFIFDMERDSTGKLTNPTQVKKYILRDVTFRVGDTRFAGISSSETTTTTTSTEDAAAQEAKDLLNNFTNINVNFHDAFGFSNFNANAYVVFPTGEKVIISRYSGGAPTSLSFRMPKLSGQNVSYTIEAHAGDALKGSDVVINDMHEGDSAEVHLLMPPSGLKPNYGETGTTTPALSWTAVDQAKAYQAELSLTSTVDSWAWEGFTDSTSINYPSTLDALRVNAQYNYQVLAMDFNPGGLNILSNKTDKLSRRAIKTGKSKNDLQFSIKLYSHSGKLPKGYRISYDTVLFRAK